ncbi:MAG TPA: replicative DNA helicase [Deltaproteobacteria bacterium]|nr:replicative DNA helicase [Deltaproteobacteria bacterium]
MARQASAGVVGEEGLQRVPPHNMEAEQSVLGAVLLEKNAINKAMEILAPDGSDFYNDVHGLIFRTMVGLSEKGMPVDIVTLADAFKDSDALDPVGGISYMADVVESTPTAANISYYAKIVKDRALVRRIIASATEIVGRGYEGVESVDDYIDDAERLIFEVSQSKTKKAFFALRDIVKDTFETIEQLYEKKSHITGVATGFHDLDSLTAGLQASDLVIIAGRPSMGKTAFALNIAMNAAIEDKVPAAIFSLEMSKEQLVQRMLATRSRVDMKRIRTGALKEEDWGRLTLGLGPLYEAPIYIDDTPAQTVLQMRAKARRLKSEVDLGLLVVDYLQLARGRGRADSREQEISEISRSLKALAKELDIPVVALSQLSRETERREDKRPRLADLRESGAIEQDADVVMFVYRKAVYCKCPKDEDCACGAREDRTAEIIIEKQRNGPTGTVFLTFMNEYTRFEDQISTDIDDYGGKWVED